MIYSDNTYIYIYILIFYIYIYICIYISTNVHCGACLQPRISAMSRYVWLVRALDPDDWAWVRVLGRFATQGDALHAVRSWPGLRFLAVEVLHTIEF